MIGASAISVAVVAIIGVIAVIRWGWKMTKWLWVNPKKLERRLKEQGLEADPYRFWVGDLIRMVKMQQQAKSSALPTHSHDLAPHVFSFAHHIVNQHGKNSFMWLGPTPRLILMDPEQIKDVFNRNYDFIKPHTIPIIKYLSTGLASYDADKWTRHRKIINPAFNLEKLKTLIPIACQSCNDMINKWENMLSPTDGTCEVDVCPWLKNLTKEVISRAAFGSSYEEGRQIFDLLTEQAELVMNNVVKHHIPLWRFVPTQENKRMKEIDRNVEATLEFIINKKEQAMKAGETTKDDLLGILLESNHKEIEKQGNKKNVGLSMKDVIEECKLFYIAGQETTSALLVWTMMLLSKYPDWQERAREEVLRVFGNQQPDFEALSRLKIVTMILYEVLRLYPPIVWLERYAEKDIKLGKLLVPGGVQICIPILMMHHDQQLWGDDAKEFKPNRFSEGFSKASKGTSVAFFPFGGGPRICIGQNFALLEAKMALSLILQRFSFELSPTYSHSLTTVITLQPQHGVQIILHKL
ncbi:11-oxo-beta-amyrin 30-oxidase-like [Prosopis cineraria]|uniref:11-oxo-beta-amyrin 30-oxidase-like n=1 Tax=Prosopis cineraria TaxID=364024 RepID=UPI00240FF2D8|nr:11-oxo-beta-amyrin 30-oxidase-like [Prosopis cineraria]XP_054816297.1 11-oxo-beta-amyrin 30-oxidase-like [Prosopis cineraria]